MKDNNYVKVIKETGYPIKGHKYRMGIIFPSKPTQKKLVEKTYLEDESWTMKPDRYNEILEYYLNRSMEDLESELDIGEWEIKQLDYKPNDFMNKWMDVFQVEIRKPVRFVYYFYTKKPIKIKQIMSKIKDDVIELHSDFLCTFVDITKIKELPKEIKRECIAKIPITELIKKMES